MARPNTINPQIISFVSDNKGFHAISEVAAGIARSHVATDRYGRRLAALGSIKLVGKYPSLLASSRTATPAATKRQLPVLKAIVERKFSRYTADDGSVICTVPGATQAIVTALASKGLIDFDVVFQGGETTELGATALGRAVANAN